jgi:hypothetical protein
MDNHYRVLKSQKKKKEKQSKVNRVRPRRTFTPIEGRLARRGKQSRLIEFGNLTKWLDWWKSWQSFWSSLWPLRFLVRPMHSVPGYATSSARVCMDVFFFWGGGGKMMEISDDGILSFLVFYWQPNKREKKNTHPNKSLAKAKMVEVFPVPGGP